MEYITLKLSAETEGTFQKRLDSLFGKLKGELDERGWNVENVVCARVFFSDAANQLEEFEKHPLFAELLSHCALSYVEQPPLDGSKINVLVNFSSHPVRRYGTHDKCILQIGRNRHLWQSIRFTADEVAGLTAKEQAHEAFRRHIEWLKEQGLNLKDNCVRTWLYVRDIDYNYHDVVVARNEVFRVEGLTPDTHFIASTGIGGTCETSKALVCVDFWSVDAPGLSQKYLQALDYLNPTHEYGVAFERGVELCVGNSRTVSISGTASIDKNGQCIYIGDVLKQTDRLFLNMEKLLEDGNMAYGDVHAMMVYLRDPSDYKVVNAYLENRFPNIPKVVLLAPVCRPHWLIEVECLAGDF